jgi:hypothetical protein
MLTITVQIIAILSMFTFMFTGIWGFILLIKIFNQLRYKNYLMEKLIHTTSRLSLNTENKESPKEDLEIDDVIKPTQTEVLEA